MSRWQVYIANNGVPTPGLSPTITSLYDTDTRASVLGQLAVTITELGGGWYELESSPTVPVVGVLDASAALTNAADRYVPLRLDPHDEILRAVLDGTVTVEEALRAGLARDVGGRAGGGTPTVTFFRQDGTTPAIQLQSLDANGNTMTVATDLD